MHHSSCFNETFCISYVSGTMFHDPGSSHQEMFLLFLRRKVENQIRLGLWDVKYLEHVPLFLRITPPLDSFLRVKIKYRITKTFLLPVWPAPVTLIYLLWSLLVLELPLDHVDLTSREIAMIPILAQLLRRYIPCFPLFLTLTFKVKNYLHSQLSVFFFYRKMFHAVF